MNKSKSKLELIILSRLQLVLKLWQNWSKLLFALVAMQDTLDIQNKLPDVKLMA
jgi:hypothetical protein